MAPFVMGHFANPSGSHSMARAARRALEEAREQVAALVGARPAEVVFTSGGTEADNLAVLGTLLAGGEGGPVKALCSAIEHAAVLEPLRAISDGRFARRAELAEIGVDEAAVIDIDQLSAALDDGVRLVSVMAANNEVGTVQPLAEVAGVVRGSAPAAVLHTDAVQAAGYLDLATVASGFDLVSLSAHKIGGPKGIGALIVRPPSSLQAILYGGGQEQERRSGTQNVAGAVGFGAAAAAQRSSRVQETSRLATLRDRFADMVLDLGGVTETVPRASTLPSHCHLLFDGLDHEELLVLFDRGGLCASGGASCASGALGASHVLKAMGLSDAAARSGIRFSLGHTTVPSEVERAVDVVSATLEALRGVRPR